MGAAGGGQRDFTAAERALLSVWSRSWFRLLQPIDLFYQKKDRRTNQDEVDQAVNKHSIVQRRGAGRLSRS